VVSELDEQRADAALAACHASTRRAGDQRRIRQGIHYAINATSLAQPDDPLPFDPVRGRRRAGGRVIVSPTETPLLRAPARTPGTHYGRHTSITSPLYLTGSASMRTASIS